MIIFIILLIFNSFFNLHSLMQCIDSSLYMFLYKVFPSFFIFYIISIYLLKKNILFKISFILKPFFSFENNKSYELLLLSFLISNPSTIIIAKDCFHNNLISKKDLNKLLYLSIFMNPIFLLSFFNYNFVIIIFLIQFLIIYVIDKFFPLSPSSSKNSFYNINSINIISSSFKDLSYSTLIIAFSICFMNLIKQSIINIVDIDIIKLLTAFLEVSSGLSFLLENDSLFLLKYPIILFLITFQGLAINLQVYSILYEENSIINYKKAIIIRLIESMIAFIIYLLFSYIATSLLP